MLKSNHKLDEKFVGAASSRPHFEGIAKKEKGITLIALIITVIVLLILVGVTLSVTLGDNGLVNKAKEASEATEIAMDRELLLSAVVGTIDNNGEANLGAIVLPEGFTGSNGTYTSKNGHTFNVGVDGTVTYVGGEFPEGPESSSEDLELLRRYFLGEIDETTGERPGNEIFSLMENPDVWMEEGDFEKVKFINNNIISNATDTLFIYSAGNTQFDAETYYIYLKYKNNPYVLAFETNYEDDTIICKSIDELPDSELNVYKTYYGEYRSNL